MNENSRSLSRSARYILLVLLLWVAGLTEVAAQDFIYKGLKYRVTGENTVTLLGHENGNDATGLLWLTGSVYYAGHYYSVTKIGASAFAGCTGLSSGQALSIPNSVTSIGNYAFSGCTGFGGNLTISNSTTYIGAGAFYGCTGFNLTLTIPESVTEINVSAFNGTNFSTVKWNAVNCYDIVPNSTYYGPFANMSKLKTIHIGSNVQSLPAYLFYGCSHLTTVYSQAEDPPVVGNYAFNGVNTSLQVNVPCGSGNAYQTASGWSVFNIVESNECEYLITGLADPVYAGSVSGSGTFNNGTTCTLIANPNPGYYFVVWTENGTQVSTDAEYTFTATNDRLLVAHFQQQTYTIDVSHFPSAGGSTTGGGTFTYGNSCTVTATPNPGFLFVNWTEDGNEVSTNESYTFNVTDSRSLQANFVLENIGSEQIVFADANVKAVCVANWDTNGDGELSYDEAAAVTNIGTKFEKNTDITSFDELQYFTGLTSLYGGFTHKIVMNLLVTIPYGAFYGCTNLTTVTIPNSVTLLKPCVFMSCSSLPTIDIPQSVTSIEDKVFYGCTGLTSMTINSNTPPVLGSSVFNDVDMSIPVNVPCAAINAYMIASGWNEFTNYQGIDCVYHQIYVTANPAEGGTVMGEGSYLQGTSCTLTAVAYTGYAFANWTENGTVVSTNASYTFNVTGERTIVANFNQINFDDIINFADANVKAICVANWDTNGDGELSYDEAAAVTTLGYVFSNDTTITTFNELQYFTGLTELTGSTTVYTNPSNPGVHPGPSTPQIGGGGISGSVHYYYYGEFKGCNNLTSIVIPDNVTAINTNVFMNCTNLATITVKAENPPTAVSRTFYGVNKSIPVYVPAGTILVYQSASGWNEFTNFQEIQMPSYDIAATANPVEGGTIMGCGTYSPGSSCTLTATANLGYTFINWTENGNEVSTDAVYTFTVTGNRGLVASFNQVDPGNENPTGFINGLFSVSADGDQVYFSQGNLQYIGSASTPYWKFAEHQWDYLGTTTGQGSSDQNVDRDLFCWGTSGYNHGAVCYQPWSTSQSYSDYYAYGSQNYNLNDQTGQADWGYNPISNGGNQLNQWQTLTKDEWMYVFNTRSTPSGIRYAKAQINEVNGVILLPDDWSSSYYSLSSTNSSNASFSSNTISTTQWNTLEQHGAVFLPAAGYRNGVAYFVDYSGYWSATGYDNSGRAYGLWFNESKLSAVNSSRHVGYSVRLVCSAENYSFGINAMPNPAEGGTVSGGGTYPAGADCTLTASTSEGYNFINWTEDGAVVSTEATYSFTVSGNRNLVANFNHVNPGNENPTGSINGKFSVNSDGGQVYFSQGNLQYIGSASTPYWKFAEHQWDYLGTTTGQNSSDQNVDRDLFGWGTSGYNHGANCYQPWSTSTSAADYYVYGNYQYSLYDQTGQADWGYNAISNGGNQENSGWRTLSTTEWYYVLNTRETASGIRYAKAVVNGVNGTILLPDNWTESIYVLNNANSLGSSFDGNTITEEDWTNVFEMNGAVFLPAAGYRNGASVYNVGYCGLYWSSSYQTSSSACLVNLYTSYALTQGMFYRYMGYPVRLVRVAQNFSFGINATSNPVEGGTVTGSGTYINGASCTLTVTANEGYTFVNWTENGNEVSTDAEYTFTVTGDRVLVANFNLNSHEISATANPTEGGEIAGTGDYDEGSICTLTATANEGYVFINWTENGNHVSTDAEYTFTVTGGRNLVANFSLDIYSVAATANPNEGGTVTGTDVYYHGSSCTLTATANEGYLFVNWTENGNQVSTDAEYTFMVTGNRALVANFQIAGSIISHWTPCDEGLYSGSTTVMAVVKINGIEQHSPQMELAAFCGNECRGTAWTSEFPVTHRYLALVNVYGENGDELTFKAYNHATNQELEMDPEVTITFSDDGSGTLFEPLELNFVSSAVTQTINLVSGTNWVSFNVEITLDDLKAALVAASPNAAITIKSQTQKATYNPSNGRWTGRLTTFDLSQMYKITVGTACEITFEGVRINPSEHPVTITPGANWIAYPLNTSRTPQEIFTGFAVAGDMVKSQSQKKQYNSNGRWTGQLGDLEPGKGYIYNSSATEDREFVFQTGAK